MIQARRALTPTALATLLEQAQQSLEAVNGARAPYILAVNARKESFARLYPLAARIVRALSASESSWENIYDARLLRRKLSHKGVVKKVAPVIGEGESTPTSSRSISHLDYDGKAETFAALIELVQGMPSYKPNEKELKLEALQVMLADLKAKSLAVSTTARALAKARIQRNLIMEGKDGVLETGTAVKEYIRSVFGVTSDTSKELGKLRLAA